MPAAVQRNPRPQPDARTSGCRIDTGDGFKPVTAEEFVQSWRRTVALHAKKSGGGNPRPRERTAPRSRPKGRSRSRPRAQARDGPDSSDPPRCCAACDEPLAPGRRSNARFCDSACRKAWARRNQHVVVERAVPAVLPSELEAELARRSDLGYQAAKDGACPYQIIQIILTGLPGRVLA